jgi:hypothetical protein
MRKKRDERKGILKVLVDFLILNSYFNISTGPTVLVQGSRLICHLD